jgi:hemerythrin superfamily protein
MKAEAGAGCRGRGGDGTNQRYACDVGAATRQPDRERLFAMPQMNARQVCVTWSNGNENREALCCKFSAMALGRNRRTAAVTVSVTFTYKAWSQAGRFGTNRTADKFFGARALTTRMTRARHHADQSIKQETVPMAKRAAKSKTTARRKTAAKSASNRSKSPVRAKSARAKSAARKTTARRKADARMPAGVMAKTAMTGRATAAQSVSKPSVLGKALTVAESRAAKEMMTALAVQETADDAIEMLKQDHRKVEGLFEEFETTQSKREKVELAAKICLELRVHTQLEEEILYPDAHHEIEHDLVDEAVVEHASAKDLIAQIEAGSADDHLYDAKMKVLKEYIKHHVKEEEEEMFPKLKGYDLNMSEMAEQMAMRKEQLIKQMARAK